MIVGRAYFFTPTVNTERFLSQDEPTEQVMRNFLDSIPFKTEVVDTATETQQGLVETATQAEFDAGTDNNVAGYALYARPSMIKASFDTIISTFNTEISNILTSISTIETDITTLQTQVTTLENTVVVGFQEQMPIGSMMLYPVGSAPNSKWMLCEGQSLSTTTYADLFALVGYNFGGAGANFNLPDLRNMFVAGYNSLGPAEYQTIGSGAGANTVTLTKAQIPKHTHMITNGVDGAVQSNPGNHNHNGGYSFNTIVEGGDVPVDQTWDFDEGGATGPNISRTDSIPVSAGAHTHTGNTGDGTTDGLAGQAHENRPAFVVFPYVIKVLN